MYVGKGGVKSTSCTPYNIQHRSSQLCTQAQTGDCPGGSTRDQGDHPLVRAYMQVWIRRQVGKVGRIRVYWASFSEVNGSRSTLSGADRPSECVHPHPFFFFFFFLNLGCTTYTNQSQIFLDVGYSKFQLSLPGLLQPWKYVMPLALHRNDPRAICQKQYSAWHL